VLLSDRDLISSLNSGIFAVHPLAEGAIQPSSIDFRLAARFRTFTNHRYSVINPLDLPDDLTEEVIPDVDQPFVLHPGEFVLGSTIERFELSADLAARVEGKSSLGRLGLLTHSTAGFIDPGFRGHITLELSNVANLPIELWPGMKIGQLCVFLLSSPADRPYGHSELGSKYQDQGHAVPSLFHLNRTGG
jgi:dCTP deaminase